MAAPIGSGTTPAWVNPCVLDPDQVLSSGGGAEPTNQPPIKLYRSIVIQAENSKESTDKLIPEFVLETFKDPQFPSYSKDLSYKWLPVLPEPTPDHIQSLSAEHALRSSYEYIQYYAVGLEQIVLDQVMYDGTFLDQFRSLEGKLRQVLCELQVAMLEMKIKQNADVTRNVMAQEYRDMDNKMARDLRDWIILRDFAGALHYIQTVFAHFAASLESGDDSS